MEYRKLGASALQLSTITHGAWAIGGSMWGGNEERDSIASIHASLDNGVTTIDTAPFYGCGQSEIMVGKAIKGRDRSKIQLLTKFGLVWDGSNNGLGEFGFDAQEDGKALKVYKYAAKSNVIKELEESLQRMGTDYVDLLQLHWPDGTTPIAETMEALETLVRQGKIRAAGVSNYNVGQLDEALRSTAVASDQMQYSMLDRQIETELVPYCIEHNVGIIAYSPMARGLLTGKYFADAKLKGDDHRHGYFARFDLPRVKAFLDAIAPIAAAKGATLSQLVLRWTTMQPGITVVLAGARNAQQAEGNAHAMDISISPDEMAFINSQLSLI